MRANIFLNTLRLDPMSSVRIVTSAPGAAEKTMVSSVSSVIIAGEFALLGTDMHHLVVANCGSAWKYGGFQYIPLATPWRQCSLSRDQSAALDHPVLWQVIHSLEAYRQRVSRVPMHGISFDRLIDMVSELLHTAKLMSHFGFMGSVSIGSAWSISDRTFGLGPLRANLRHDS